MSATATLRPADRAALLALARAALRHRLGQGPAPVPPADGPLATPRAAFLTITSDGAPRVALGRLTPQGPLGAAVVALAERAVEGDPRQPPLALPELPALSLRLAVLGPLRRLEAPSALRLGAEGVAVTQGWHRGVLLPSGAEGKGWDTTQFLKHACLAAGLPARAHLEPQATVEVFEAEEFGE